MHAYILTFMYILCFIYKIVNSFPRGIDFPRSVFTSNNGKLTSNNSKPEQIVFYFYFLFDEENNSPTNKNVTAIFNDCHYIELTFKISLMGHSMIMNTRVLMINLIFTF